MLILKHAYYESVQLEKLKDPTNGITYDIIREVLQLYKTVISKL